MLLANQKSSKINGGNSTKDFILEVGAFQGDPVSILPEIAFIMIK